MDDYIAFIASVCYPYMRSIFVWRQEKRTRNPKTLYLSMRECMEMKYFDLSLVVIWFDYRVKRCYTVNINEQDKVRETSRSRKTSRHEEDVDVHKTSEPRTVEDQVLRADARTDVRQRWGDGARTVARLGARAGRGETQK